MFVRKILGQFGLDKTNQDCSQNQRVLLWVTQQGTSKFIHIYFYKFYLHIYT